MKIKKKNYIEKIQINYYKFLAIQELKQVIQQMQVLAYAVVIFYMIKNPFQKRKSQNKN